MLTRDQILKFEDRKLQKVDVPQWGDFVYIRSLTGSERDEFEEANLVRTRDRKRGTMSYDVRLQNAKVRLIAMTACDEQGNRIFNDEDVEALGKKNSAAISLLYNVSASLSGITDEDVEELLKN